MGGAEDLGVIRDLRTGAKVSEKDGAAIKASAYRGDVDAITTKTSLAQRRSYRMKKSRAARSVACQNRLFNFHFLAKAASATTSTGLLSMSEAC